MTRWMTLLLVVGSLSAQSFTSRFGYGEFINTPSAYASSVGYATVAWYDSVRVLTDNPAAWTGFEHVMFTMNGGMRQVGISSTSDGTVQLSSYGLQSVQFALPVGDDWGISFGLQPVTAMNGELEENTSLGTLTETQQGGIWQYSAGFGYRVREHIQIGARLEWLRGSRSLNSVLSLDTSLVASTTEVETELSGSLRGQSIGVGAQLQATETLRLGINLDLPVSNPVYSGERSLVGTARTIPFEETLGNWPLMLSAGISFRYKPRLIVLGGLSQKVFHTGSFQDAVLLGIPAGWSVHSIGAFHLGFVRTPLDRFGRGWFERTEWRAGFSSQNIYVSPVSDRLVSEYFGALGLSFALPESRSFLDVGLEIGKRNGIQSIPDEWMTRMTIGIQWNELWFRNVKRR